MSLFLSKLSCFQLHGGTSFVMGDSAVAGRRNRLGDFVNELDQVITGKRLNVHIELDDPSGNSYLQVSM